MDSALRVSARLLAVLSCCTLAACGDKDAAPDLAKLEAKVAANATDPALREAIEAPIATDPDLRRESNRDALKPADRPLDGALPAQLPAPDVKAQVARLTGGKLLSTPAATRTVTSTGDAITLSGIAAQQGLSAACEDPRLRYDFGWAQRLPAYLPLYPGAALKDAAGTDDPRCAIRAATFATGAASSQVLDFYYSMARRAGFSVEHIELNGNDALKGSKRQNGAYFYLALRPATDGAGVEADLVTSQQR